MLGIGAIAIAVLSLASFAFACTTYQGKLTLQTAGGTSISQGDNNCGHTGGCGAGNGSMTFCGSVQFGATYNDSSATNATVTMGTTDNCPAGNGQNHLAGNTQYGINIRKVDSMSSSDTSIQDPEDCMDWTLPNSTHIVTITTSSGGGFTTVVSLPSGSFSNTSGWSAGLCVSDATSDFGNQTPITVV